MQDPAPPETAAPEGGPRSLEGTLPWPVEYSHDDLHSRLRAASPLRIEPEIECRSRAGKQLPENQSANR